MPVVLACRDRTHLRIPSWWQDAHPLEVERSKWRNKIEIIEIFNRHILITLILCTYDSTNMIRTATTRAKPCRHVVDVDPKVRTTATPSAPEMRAWMTLDALVPSSEKDVEEKKNTFWKNCIHVSRDQNPPSVVICRQRLKCRTTGRKRTARRFWQPKWQS